MIAETHGTGGSRGGSQFPLPYVYDVPAASRTHTDVFVNCGGARAMRAPGHPQGCAIMEAAMDDLADKLGIDPLEFRLKNLASKDFRTPIYEAEVKIGAELIGWRENRKPRGQNGKGPIKRGLGMALHTWGGGGAQDKQVTCTINPDGSVELKSATQDIGTGARTILAIIAAEVLGLKVDRHQVEHRQLDLPARPGLGRLDDHAVDEPADLRRGHPGPRRALREDRPGPRTPSPRTSRSRTARSWSRASPGCPGRRPAASSA